MRYFVLTLSLVLAPLPMLAAEGGAGERTGSASLAGGSTAEDYYAPSGASQTGSKSSSGANYYQTSYSRKAAAQYESAGDNEQASPKPWTFTFTQTADYGTNLSLPIGLTPANTLISPLGNAGAAGILTNDTANQLGIQDNLGLIGGVVGDVPSAAVFQNDMQFQTTAGLQYQRDVGADGNVTAGYSYYQNLHPQVEQLDLNSHALTTQYAHRLNDRLVGALDYGYTYYLLDGDTFVTQNRVGASLLLRQNELWSWQVRGDYADANFRQATFLNSDNYSARFEGIRYLDEQKDYLTFGYAMGYSDAQFRGFGYQVNNLFAGGRWLFGESDRNDFRATVAYGIYDFFGTDPIDVGVARQDEILTINLLLGRQLTDYWSVFGSYTWLDSQSNVVRQDYDSHLISTGVTYTR